MRSFRQATVYFASGTGNSYLVGAWFRDAAEARGIPAVLTPVARADPRRDIAAAPDELVVLAFPTHGGLPPWSVIKFLLRMPRRKGAGFLCLPTRGSFFVGPLLVPGAAILASFLPPFILAFKGYRPLGAVSFDMPANITAVHPPLTSRHAGRVVARARAKFDRSMDRFFGKGRVWLTRNNAYEAIWSLAVLRFIPLFPLLYLVLGRFFMGKVMFANDRCTGCGICAAACPAGALVMVGRNVPRPYWRYNCEHCLRCLNYCPHQAIGASLPWAAFLWWLGSAAALAAAVFSHLTALVPGLEAWRGYWTVELVNSLVYYPVFIAAYALFHVLNRIKFLNVVLSRTSPSFFLGQYRAPGTALPQLTGRTDASRPHTSTTGDG
ncbi:MAG: 4Fe-4S dicluster domain-containing protein [Candidatus Aminicenantes bacterium]|nr:4Fe-4S dicluster domain-containing protein [Candidatus Aminicenantes bacterium]